MKLISHYLDTRLGDCVSMPLLFLILADRMGLNVALSTVPLHVFVRHIDTAGRVTNLETTSGANPARDEWVRRIRPTSDRAIRSGLHMRTLSRREGIALMATTVLQYLMDSRRYEEAIEVAQAILEQDQRNSIALINLGRRLRTDPAPRLPRPLSDAMPHPAQSPAALPIPVVEKPGRVRHGEAAWLGGLHLIRNGHLQYRI